MAKGAPPRLGFPTLWQDIAFPKKSSYLAGVVFRPWELSGFVIKGDPCFTFTIRLSVCVGQDPTHILIFLQMSLLSITPKK